MLQSFGVEGPNKRRLKWLISILEFARRSRATQGVFSGWSFFGHFFCRIWANFGHNLTWNKRLNLSFSLLKILAKMILKNDYFSNFGRNNHFSKLTKIDDFSKFEFFIWCKKFHFTEKYSFFSFHVNIFFFSFNGKIFICCKKIFIFLFDVNMYKFDNCLNTTSVADVSRSSPGGGQVAVGGGRRGWRRRRRSAEWQRSGAWARRR